MPTAGNGSLRSILRRGRELLLQTERPEDCDAAFEAFLLLQKVYGVTRENYPLRAEEVPSAALWAEYESLLRRRLRGEPVQYLLGEWEFMGLPFSVGPGVLIPRPETELLAETVLGALRGIKSPQVLELCGGSGCLAVSIAHARPDAKVTTVELSTAALPYLRENAARDGCRNLTILAGDALAPTEEITAARYHAILSNPPYIETAELPRLQREVQQEPAMALDGGEDGLRFYRAFCALYPPLLLPGALLAFEIGESEGAAVQRLMAQAGLSEIALQKDYAGLPRIVTGRKPE